MKRKRNRNLIFQKLIFPNTNTNNKDLTCNNNIITNLSIPNITPELSFEKNCSNFSFGENSLTFRENSISPSLELETFKTFTTSDTSESSNEIDNTVSLLSPTRARFHSLSLEFSMES